MFALPFNWRRGRHFSDHTYRGTNMNVLVRASIWGRKIEGKTFLNIFDGGSNNSSWLVGACFNAETGGDF